MKRLIQLLAACIALGPAPAVGKPNIIVFLADDLGFETLPAYGGSSYQTPHLDRLAEDGMRFDSCIATPMCATSRAMLLTGKHNFRNYRRWAHLDPAEPTIATLLHAAGYTTGMAGKWHLGNWEPDEQGRRGPARFGFDHYLSCMVDRENIKSRDVPGSGNAYWKTSLVRNNRDEEPLSNIHSEQAYLDFTRAFLRENRDRPFFFHYASYLAHRPFVRVAEPGPDDFNEHGNIKNFPAMITRLDAIVGALRAELDALGIGDNTLFVFTSDNGTDNVREASSLRSAWRGKKIRGGKYHVSETGTTVPCFMLWPGKTAPSSSTRTAVDFTDFLPTFLDVAGAGIPAGLDGQSLLPVLTGEQATRGRPAFTWGTLDGSNRVYHDPPRHRDCILHAARDERWRYLSDGRLYDVAADPLMRQPVDAGISPEADAARTRLRNALEKLRDSPSILW